MSPLHRLRSLIGQHRRLTATAIAAAVVLIAAALVAFAVTRGDGPDATQMAAGPITTPPGSGVPGQEVAPLTGLPADRPLDRPALFVKIDNVERPGRRRACGGPTSCSRSRWRAI